MDPDPDVCRGRSVVYTMHVHLVFTTKYRGGALTDAILTRCEQIMRNVCVDFGAQLCEFNGEDDRLKGVSSRYLRQEHGTHLRRYLWGDHLWSPSYLAGSCGAPLAVIKEYVENQKRPAG